MAMPSKSVCEQQPLIQPSTNLDSFHEKDPNIGFNVLKILLQLPKHNPLTEGENKLTHLPHPTKKQSSSEPHREKPSPNPPEDKKQNMPHFCTIQHPQIRIQTSTTVLSFQSPGICSENPSNIPTYL